MKKILYSFLTVLVFNTATICQVYDDGMISSRLSINTNSEKFNSFISGFHSGLSMVRKGELTSADAVKSYYGVDLTTIPRLENVVAQASWNIYNGQFSSSFLQGIQSCIEKAGSQYTDLSQFRNDLMKLSTQMRLSASEADALVLVDLCVQELNRQYFNNAVSHNDEKGMNAFEPTYEYSLAANYEYVSLPSIIDVRIPKWVKCALGVIGSAILGGIGGASSGGQIGGAIGGVHGAAVGAAAGGITGIIGGTFTGIATFCD